MTTMQTVITIALFTLATVATRAGAFLLFPASKPTPGYVAYLGRILPFSITAMLIVFCLKDVDVFSGSHGFPELISIALVAGLFLKFKNSLLAIASGTALYMVLVQFVF